jgi:hypothetical protein
MHHSENLIEFVTMPTQKQWLQGTLLVEAPGLLTVAICMAAKEMHVLD